MRTLLRIPFREWLIPGALLLIGCGAPISYLIGSNDLRNLLDNWGATPSFEIFAAVNGIEPFFLSGRLSYSTVTGRSGDVTIGAPQFLLFPTYYQASAYGIPMIFAQPWVQGARTGTYVRTVLKYGLCDGPLSAAFGMPRGIASFVLQQTPQNPRTRIPDGWRIPIHCLQHG